MNKEEIKLIRLELILDYIKNNDYSKQYRRMNDTLAMGNEVLENIESILYITTLDNYNKLKQENKQLKEKYLNAVSDYEQEKSKNNKAIEYIEYINIDEIFDRCLLEILKGDSNE